MKSHPLLSLAALTLTSLTPPAHADVYIEAKVMGNMPAKVWTSGLKQRLEAPNPITGGSMVVVTRVDKGVTWKIDAAQKAYEEKAIAVAYKPKPQASGSAGTTSPSPGDTNAADKLEVRPIPEPRTIAGFSATGYEMIIDQKPTGRMWMATPTGDLIQADKESAAFQEAYSKKMYENYPATEQAGMVSGMKMMGDLLKGALGATVPGAGKLPKGFPLSMENMTENDGRQQLVTVFEVLKVGASPLPDDQFEIPAGFQKVDDLMARQMQQLLKGGNLEEMMKQFQKSGIGGGSTGK